MARPREFDEKQALDAIKQVFWTKGFDGASYADLTAATGLHKASLYAAFGDKRQLYLHALSDYDAEEIATTMAALNEGAAPAKDRIAAAFDAILDAVARNDRRGCMLCNAAIDQAPHDADVSRAVAAGIARMRDGFEAALMQDAPTPDAREKADLLTAAYLGLRVMSKSDAPVAMLEGARKTALAQI